MVGVEWGVPTQPAWSGAASVCAPSRKQWVMGHPTRVEREWLTYRMYMMTPRDHMSQDLSYFSGPSTSGAEDKRVGFGVQTKTLRAAQLQCNAQGQCHLAARCCSTGTAALSMQCLCQVLHAPVPCMEQLVLQARQSYTPESSKPPKQYKAVQQGAIPKTASPLGGCRADGLCCRR